MDKQDQLFSEIEKLNKEIADLQAELHTDTEDGATDLPTTTNNSETDVEILSLVRAGVTKDGKFLFDIVGDTSIVVVEGIRRYFNERMNKEWSLRVPDPVIGGDKDVQEDN